MAKISERVLNLDGRIRVVGVFTRSGAIEEIMVRPDIKETHMPMDLIKQFGPQLAVSISNLVEKMKPWHGGTSWIVFSQDRVNLIVMDIGDRIITVTSGKSIPPSVLAEKLRNGLKDMNQSRT